MIMVYGFTQATCTCFKEAALLFTVHLSSFVIFILCLTDKYLLKVTNSTEKYMFKVSKLVSGNCGSSLYC